MIDSPSPVYRLPPTVVLRELDGQTVLFSKQSGEFFGLNDSAAVFVADLLQAGFEDALGKAAALYQASAEDLRGDFQELVDDLIAQGLLEKT